MSTDMHTMKPVRAVAATLVGGVLGGALGFLIAPEALEPGAIGLQSLGHALRGFMAGATLGATAAVAVVFGGADRRGAGVTALTVLGAGLLWGLLWAVEPGLLFPGVVLLPLGALLGRWLSTR